MRRTLSVVWVIGVLCAASAPADEAADARRILDEAGVKGGLVVHLGCGDGKLTAALHANDSFIVQGLEADAPAVAKARDAVRAAGLYGKVSVIECRGPRLPYADNMVNLLVAADLGEVSPEEVLRVLAPSGSAMVRKGDGWAKTVKPRPADIDEWTHWLHDAGNNATAHDTRVGPPRRMQWVADPLWSRGHELISSVGGVVTAGGRIFAAVDEGQPGIYTLPSKWTLVARDAFNGVLLWKLPLPHWGPEVSLGGFTRGFRPRRLATDGQRVYLPMGEEDVLTALDAATGKAVGTVGAARGATDVLCADGLVVVVASPQDDAEADKDNRRGGAGAPRWSLVAARTPALAVAWQAPAPGIYASTAALAGGRVLFSTRDGVIALDAATGREAWRANIHERPKDPDKDAAAAKGGKAADTKPKKAPPAPGAGTLVAHDGKVYFLAGSTLTAMSAQTGKVLWQQKNAGSGKGELFAAGGLVWVTKGSGTGFDPATGELRRQISVGSGVFSPGHHPRCYPYKATDRYIISNNRGAEFLSLTGEEHVGNDWVRGNCGHGVMPANGLLYAPPCQCFCYPGIMLTGFKALAAAAEAGGPAVAPATDPGRLQRGPAYADVQAAKAPAAGEGDWATYRHDAGRLGATTTAVPANLRPLWQVRLGTRLTPPVVAGGTLLVAAIDAHTVHAFDAGDGKPRWSFTAGGRIDSPPTIHEGLALFGSADGWAYCLRAADGALVWRFLAAPAERLVGAFGQVESAWPVHGSVAILNGVVYVTAGRSTWLDGGIHAYGLDARSGRVVHHALLAGAVADVPKSDGKSPYVPAFHVEGARTDLLVTDGQCLYMGPLKLDATLKCLPTAYVEPTGKTEGLDLTQAPYVDTGIFKQGLEKKRDGDFPSLGVLRGPMGDKAMGLRVMATGGLLDDTWFNRPFWMYSTVWPGYYIAHLGAKCGQLLSVDATTTYGVQAFPSRTIHSATFKAGTTGYLLFADDNANEPVLDDRTRGRDKGMGFTRTAPPKWFQWVPVRIRAMVAAGPTLFVAGPPDVAEESDPYAAFEGRKGGCLWAFAAADGKKLAELPLDSPPVFDGLIAAAGRLYLSARDGKVVCLGGK